MWHSDGYSGKVILMSLTSKHRPVGVLLVVVLSVIAAFLIAGTGAARAQAASGSIVFIKDDNVWIMGGTDPTTARPVTTDGTPADRYYIATLDDQGVIIAARGDGYGDVVRMDQRGKVLANFRPPSYAHIEDLEVTPDGRLLAVSSFGVCSSGSENPGAPAGTILCSRIDLVTADTGKKAGPTLFGDNFGSWWSNRDMVITDIDLGVRQALGIYRVGEDQEQAWFDLCASVELCFPMQPDMTRQGDRLVVKIQGAISLDQPSLLQVWSVNNRPPAQPDRDCALVGPSTGGQLDLPEFFGPTWSPDGDALAWQLGAGGSFDSPPPGAGIYVADGFDTDCADAFADARLIVPGGQFPDWSPAPLGGGTTPDVPDVPVVLDNVERLAGSDRLATAVAISKDSFPDPGSAQAIVLARSDQFADALAGTPLAHAQDAPMLLTAPSALDARIASEIRRALGSDMSKTVYLLGGRAALSDRVEAQVGDLGYRVKRIAGDDRITTAIRIAEELGPVSRYFVTTGFNFADALAAGPAAAVNDGAVLLTVAEGRSPDTDAFLDAHPEAERYAIGGPAARPYNEATAVFGENREATATAVAERFFDGPLAVGLARSDSFPDALTGGTHSARQGGPMLLSRAERLADAAREYLCATASVERVHGYGGPSALADTVLAAADNAIGRGC